MTRITEVYHGPTDEYVGQYRTLSAALAAAKRHADRRGYSVADYQDYDETSLTDCRED